MISSSDKPVKNGVLVVCSIAAGPLIEWGLEGIVMTRAGLEKRWRGKMVGGRTDTMVGGRVEVTVCECE